MKMKGGNVKDLMEGAKSRFNKKTGKVEVFWEESEPSQPSQDEYSSTDSEEYEDE